MDCRYILIVGIFHIFSYEITEKISHVRLANYFEAGYFLKLILM